MTKELTTTKEQQEAIELLRQGSGEDNTGGGFTFIPYITVNNNQEEAEIEKNGKKKITEDLCDPSFNITEKDENGEYNTALFVDEFRAAVLKVRWRIQRKYKKSGNVHNHFRSLEFDSFQDMIDVRQDKEFLQPMTYQQAKAWAGDENELWGIMYVLIEGEETVRKVEVKGASRSALFDYLGVKKSGGSISSTITKFSAELNDEGSIKYNFLVLTDTGEMPKDLMAVVGQQKELNELLSKSSTPSTPAISGEVQAPVDMDEMPADKVSLVDSEAAVKQLNGDDNVEIDAENVF